MKLDRHSQLEGFAVGPGRNKHKHQQKQLEFSTRNYNSGAWDQNLAFPQAKNLRRDYFRAICIWQSSLCHRSGPVAHRFYSPLEESAAMISRPPPPLPTIIGWDTRVLGVVGAGHWALPPHNPGLMHAVLQRHQPNCSLARAQLPASMPTCSVALCLELWHSVGDFLPSHSLVMSAPAPFHI